MCAARVRRASSRRARGLDGVAQRAVLLAAGDAATRRGLGRGLLELQTDFLEDLELDVGRRQHLAHLPDQRVSTRLLAAALQGGVLLEQLRQLSEPLVDEGAPVLGRVVAVVVREEARHPALLLTLLPALDHAHGGRADAADRAAEDLLLLADRGGQLVDLGRIEQRELGQRREVLGQGVAGAALGNRGGDQFCCCHRWPPCRGGALSPAR